MMAKYSQAIRSFLDKWSKAFFFPVLLLLGGIIYSQHTTIVRQDIERYRLSDEKGKWEDQCKKESKRNEGLEREKGDLQEKVRKLEEAIDEWFSVTSPGPASAETQKLQTQIEWLSKENKDLRKQKEALEQRLSEITGKTAPVATEAQIKYEKIAERPGGTESHGIISGKVVRLKNPNHYKIVIYTQTDHWYAQPLKTDYFTNIEPDGTWSNWVHLGEKYAAILVEPSYEPPTVTDTLPATGGEILAKTIVTARKR